MKVSFIVPMYGVAPYIEQCARSLFDQTLESCEFIFVDDSSPDNSSEILMELVSGEFSHMQERITLVRHASNLGVSEARNTALKVAKGDFVIFVDGDDWVDPDLAEELVIEQINRSADIVSSSFYEVHKGGNHLCRAPFIGGQNGSLQIVASQNFAIPNRIWGLLIRRSMLVESGVLFDPQLTMGEDFLALVKMIYHSRVVAHTSAPLYYYNMGNADSAMNNISQRHKKSYIRAVYRAHEFLSNRGDYRFTLMLQRLNVKKWMLLRSPRRSHPLTFIIRLFALCINTLMVIYAYLRG